MATCPTCRTRYPDSAKVCSSDGEALLPDEAFSAADTELQAGQMIGEYQLEAKIGEGGFGAVYRAVHPVIGKAAAVKVLHRQYSSNPQMVSRFISEARAVNQIRHRNIIDIFSFGTLPDGRQYYVMELLDGMPFDRYLAERGPLSVAHALPILRQIARALDAAHAAGIAHRDLKPENVFLVFDEDGGVFPKLLDFGIAKLLGEASGGSHKTRTGTPMGTPYFMSPEQCRGKSVDHRTDIYSFGVMTHLVLTGKLPFEAEDVIDLLVKQTQAEPPTMSSVLADLPPALDPPVLHMLEKLPEKRPQSLLSAVDELARAAAEAGLASPVVSAPNPVVSSGSTPRAFGSSLSTASGDGASKNRSDAAHAATAVIDGGSKTMLAAESDAQRPPRRPALLFAGLGVAAVAAALTVVALRPPPPDPALASGAGRAAASTGSPAASFASPASPASPGSPASQPTQPPEPKVAPAAEPSAPQVALAAAPSEVQLTVQGAPAGAEVFLGQDRLGVAPGPFAVKRGEAPVKITVKASGFAPRTFDWRPASSDSLTVKLFKAGGRVNRDLESPF